MATPRYHAINVIRSGGIVVPPFVAESLLPKGSWIPEGGYYARRERRGIHRTAF